jgi:hypothetical protein
MPPEIPTLDDELVRRHGRLEDRLNGLRGYL